MSAAPAASDGPVIDVREAHRAYGERRALAGVSLSVRRGEIYRLTEDHTWATYMAKTRLIDPADLVDHPYSNVLSRSVGNQPHVEVDTTYVQVEPVDGYLAPICLPKAFGADHDRRSKSPGLSSHNRAPHDRRCRA